MSNRSTEIDRYRLKDVYAEYIERLNNFVPLVVICGAGPCPDAGASSEACAKCSQEKKAKCAYSLRLELRECLNRNNCLAALFETDFGLQIPSLEESVVLQDTGVDKVILISEDSQGAAAELALFARDEQIRSKLIVLVPYEYHPFYSDSKSFLTSLYTELLASSGRVYPFERAGKIHPTPVKIVLQIIQAYRSLKIIELL